MVAADLPQSMFIISLEREGSHVDSDSFTCLGSSDSHHQLVLSHLERILSDPDMLNVDCQWCNSSYTPREAMGILALMSVCPAHTAT